MRPASEWKRSPTALALSSPIGIESFTRLMHSQHFAVARCENAPQNKIEIRKGPPHAHTKKRRPHGQASGR